MAKVNIRVRPETETLYLDFFFRGARCREQTALVDTPEHRKRLQALANRIQKEIERGTFDYGAFFPNSPKAEVFAIREGKWTLCALMQQTIMAMHGKKERAA